LYKLNYKKFIAVGLLLVMIFSVSGCKDKDKGLVARVDGEEITEIQFNTEFEVYKKVYEQQLGEGNLSQIAEDGRTIEENLRENIVEKLIMEVLIEKETTAQSIEVTPEEIKEQMDEYMAIMGGEEKFNEFLVNNQLTKEFFEENLRKELLFNKHRESFMNNTTITDEEAIEFFEANKDDLVVIKASHILLKSEEDGKKVLERLNSGEDFAELAKEVSIDKTSGLLGGSLGYFAKGNFIAEFEETAFALNVGETSGLVKTEVGYHIIYLEDKKDSFEALKEDIISLLKDDKYLEKIQDMRNNAKVKIFLDL